MQEGRWKLQYFYKTLLVWRWRCVFFTSNKFCNGVLGLDSLFILKSPVHPVLGYPGGWFHILFKNIYNHVVTARYSSPSTFTSPEKHSWMSPLVAIAAQSPNHRLNTSRESAEYRRCPSVYLSFLCTSCCSVRRLTWPVRDNLNNYTGYFVLESSAWSSLQRWILENHLLCHRSSDKAKSLSVYRHLLDVCWDYKNICFSVTHTQQKIFVKRFSQEIISGNFECISM